MNSIKTHNQQLELGLNGAQLRLGGRGAEGRVARGQWWFSQMRAAVAGAMVWPAPGQPAAGPAMFTAAQNHARV